jgi:hypothetical protein
MSPHKGNGPPDEKEPAPHVNGDRPSPNTTATDHIRSQQVNWLTVHRFVAAVLNQVNDWPTAGTPAWCSLAHDDPAKWCALLDGAQHWALRVDSCQEAHAAASRDISAAADWSAVGRETLQRNEFYAARPWLRRVS